MNGKWSQGSVSQTAWEFSAQMDSRRVCSILVQSHIPVFIHFVLFCPSTLPPLTSLRSPSPCQPEVLLQQRIQTKAMSAGLKCLPSHNTENRSGKINATSALSSRKSLWDAGWQGGADRRDAQHLRGYHRSNGGTGLFIKELGIGTDK